MNIDFHYGVVYVLSRLAGLDSSRAETVAHASQYVDDATTHGILRFEGGEAFERFASSHEMIDHQNVENRSNRDVWMPFHFLPGNVGDTIDEKAICKPDSLIAREVVRHAIKDRDQDNALHRLGVTLHVYVDTFAHYGFAGIVNKVNQVQNLEGHDINATGWFEALKQKVKHLFDNEAAFALSKLLPLGHGAALHYPDIPWAKWSYTDGLGNKVERDNLGEYLTAAEMVCRVVRAHSNGNENFADQPGLAPAERVALKTLLTTITDADPQKRLAILSEKIANGVMPGLTEAIPPYIAKGLGSWKHLATGIDSDGDGINRPIWSKKFEQSDYRKFHDAVKEHRFVVMQRILPAHNLRLA